MDHTVKTNNDKVISLVCSSSSCLNGEPYPRYCDHNYSIDVSTGEKIRLQDYPNFSKYVENIFYDKNYSIDSVVSEGDPEDMKEEIKGEIFSVLNENSISDLKNELINHQFYYENGKVAILFEVNHAFKDIAYLVME